MVVNTHILAYHTTEVQQEMMELNAQFIAQFNVEKMKCIAMEEAIIGVVLKSSFVFQVKEAQLEKMERNALYHVQPDVTKVVILFVMVEWMRQDVKWRIFAFLKMVQQEV